MLWKPLFISCVICGCLSSSGCTYQAWFEGFKERQRQECLKHVSNDAIQRCLDEVGSMTYEEYERSRRERP